MLLPHEKLAEAEAYIKRQQKVIDELISLNLWSARRITPRIYKSYVYDEIEKITNTKYERL